MLIGHQKQREFLKKSATLDRLAHAYLFSGPESIGKKAVALKWASALIGEDIEKKAHPDLILVGPDVSIPEKNISLARGEKEKKESEIKISQIRNLIWKLSLKPYSAPYKVAIIDNAHLMNEESQNCLLKTLEEPKEKTILILITEYPKMMLPTIFSRCQTIKFYSVPQKEIKNYLEQNGADKTLVRDILRISLGRPGRAIEYFLNTQNDWQKAVGALNKLLKTSLISRFEYAKELSQKNNIREVLEIWMTFFQQMLLSRFCPDLYAREENTNADHYTAERLKKILTRIQYIDFLLSKTNINPRLALETLMLEL